MKKITGWLLGAYLLVGGMGIAVAQDTTPPPKVLAVYREFVKPGKGGALHEKAESAFVQAMTRAKWPTHYFAASSITGKPRVLFFTAYESFEAWEDSDVQATGSPATGRSIASRWTRIWCVRPVSSRTRRSACRGSSSSSSKCVTAAARRVRVERVADPVVAVAADRRVDRPAAATAASRRRARGTRGSARAAARAAAAARTPPASARRRAGRTCRGRGGGRCPGRSSSPPVGAGGGERLRRACRRRDRAPGARRRRRACPRRGGARPSYAIARSGSATAVLGSRRPAARSRSPPRPRACGSCRAARPSTSTAPASRSRSAAAREPTSGSRREIAVEPLARGLGRDDEPLQRSPAVGSRSARTSAARRIPTPITMKLSARLNAGQ